MMYGFKEIERTRLFSYVICKLDTVLSDEWTLLELFQQAHPLKSPVSVSHQRLADVMPRKFFLFKKDYAATLALQNAGDRAACGSTTDYNDVVLICIHAYRTVLSSG